MQPTKIPFESIHKILFYLAIKIFYCFWNLINLVFACIVAAKSLTSQTSLRFLEFFGKSLRGLLFCHIEARGMEKKHLLSFADGQLSFSFENVFPNKVL